MAAIFFDFQQINLIHMLRKSLHIPRSSPKIFFPITMIFILPLSFSILAPSRFTIPLYEKPKHHPLFQYFIFMYGIPGFVIAFSLLSTIAVVFTAASLYNHRPVSFTSTLSAIPDIFIRFFSTFLVKEFVMHAVYPVYYLLVILASLVKVTEHLYVFSLLSISFFIIFLMIHSYITVIWHLASVISILEPIHGFAAMKKSKKLLAGKTMMGMKLVLLYWSMCVVTHIAYCQCNLIPGVFVRYSLKVLVIGVLVFVNLIALLVQSIFYFVCNSQLGKVIGKHVFYENLGAYYFGNEYMPLQSDIIGKNSELDFEEKDGIRMLKWIVYTCYIIVVSAVYITFDYCFDIYFSGLSLSIRVGHHR